LRDTYNFVLAFYAHSSFDAKSPALRPLLADAYRNSTRIAVISHHLAGEVSGVSSGRAMLGGLLQDIGVAPILVCLSQGRGLPENPSELNRALDTLCPLVGTLVLQSWGFGEDLLEVARSRKQWYRDPQEKADLADLVLVARLHAAIGTPEFHDCPPLTALPAFSKLALGELTPRNSLRMVEESREELDEIERLLSIPVD
jgi:HD-like signal output (HDOD) protein